ncbi:MAG: RNA 2',3'-cyclic phosphodiesterase [Pirellulales bacterium]
MPRPLRLFVAIDPPRETIAASGRIIERLKRAGVQAAWVQPERQHLTLQFLGDEIDDADLHRICVAIDEAASAVAPFAVAYGGVGVFPDTRRPRVLWLGVTDGEADLVRLHDALAARLEPLGFPGEARRYRPHLTLGRFRGGGHTMSGDLATALDACATVDAGGGPVTRLCLYESQIAKEGSRYDRLHVVQLGAKRG